MGRMLCKSCEILQKNARNIEKGGRKLGRTSPNEKKLIKLENEEEYMK